MSALNTAVINAGYVGPNEDSSSKLGEGTYSLNKRSNVPFVSLVGSAGYKKTISWGELVEVPCGQLVTVHNSSYHGGDIYINKGPDICNRPSRITVPVPLQVIYTTPFDEEGRRLAVYGGLYPCDTRAAKRAYACIDANVLPGVAAGLTFFIRGRRLDGSMNCANVLATMAQPFGPGVGFMSAILFPPNTQLSYIPLGQGAIATDDTRPHTLLDAGDVFANLGNVSVPFLPGTLLEWPASVNVPGFPASFSDLPGSWYVIEYD